MPDNKPSKAEIKASGDAFASLLGRPAGPAIKMKEKLKPLVSVGAPRG